MTKQQNISALILSGGQGSRMNSLDKGLVSFQGKPLITYVIERLSSQVKDIYISCNRNEDAYQTFGFPLLNDHPFPSEGPLCAIAAALAKISCDRLLVVPCDTPYLPDNLLKLLNDGLDSGPYKVASISNGNSIQPLFSMIDMSLGAMLADKVNAGLRKTQDWIFSQEHILIRDDRTSLYTNLNSFSDIEIAISTNSITKDS